MFILLHEKFLQLIGLEQWYFSSRWLNTVSQAVSGNSRDSVCFKLDKQTWWQRKQ